MAKKGFFHAFLSSITVAILSFFIMYFFIPSMSMQFPDGVLPCARVR